MLELKPGLGRLQRGSPTLATINRYAPSPVGITLLIVHERLDYAGEEFDLTFCGQPSDRNGRPVDLRQFAAPNAVLIIVADVELIHRRRKPHPSSSWAGQMMSVK
jgi:hypothetical protein